MSNIRLIRNRDIVIDTENAAIETAFDVRMRNETCISQKSNWYVTLCFTVDAFQTFLERLNGTMEIIRLRDLSEVSSEKLPIFKGCETKIVRTVQVGADYRTYNDKPKLWISEVCADRCIFVNKKYYKVYKSRDNGGRYLLHFAVQTTLYQEYYNKITTPESPNFVGVMTPKKLKAWVKYCDEIERLLEQKKTEIEARIASFKERLKSIAPDKVDESYGCIKKNGIKYSWNLDNNGNANESIDIDTYSCLGYDYINLFMMLSDNKFVP